MDRDRIRDAALGKRMAAGRAASRRLIVYAALVAVIGGWYAVNYVRREPVVEQMDGPAEPLEVPARVNVPLARIDPALLAGVRDGTRDERALLEPVARRHLLEQASQLVYGDLETLGLERADHAALLSEPGAWRGRPVWTLGTLAWMQSDPVEGLLEVRGEIVDEQGRSWAFFVVTEPYQIAVGDVVRVSGFFFKVYDMLRPDRSFVTAPLLVGEELLRSSFRIPPVTDLDQDLRRRLHALRDRDIESASQPLESPEFYELLSFVQHAGLADVLPGGGRPEEVTPLTLLQDSSSWRARPVGVTGRLLYTRRRPLGPRGENPLGLPFVWELWVSDNRDGDAGSMYVLSLEEPAGVETGDILDVDGIFFRRWAFENKLNHPRMAAVILARRVRVFEPPADLLTPTLANVIVGLVSVLLVVILIGQWRERRALASARTRRIRRQQELIARPGRLHEGTAPDPAAGESTRGT